MKLKSEYFKMIDDLGNWSMELAIQTNWSKDGFSSDDFNRWLYSVSVFLKFALRNSPSELISASSQFDYDFSNFGISPQESKKAGKND